MGDCGGFELFLIIGMLMFFPTGGFINTLLWVFTFLAILAITKHNLG